MPSRKSRSSRSARRRAASLRARRSPRNKLGQFVPHRSVSKRKSRSASKSKSSRRSRRSRSASHRARRSPRNKLGQFVRRRPAVRKSKSRSRSTKSKSRTRSVKGRLSLKEQKALARHMGGNLKHMRVTSRPGGRRRLSESLAQKEKRERAALRRRRASKLADISFDRVLKHFGDVLPEQVWCPKRVCGSVYQKHKELGILPKSVADLELILSFPSEREGVNGRCWICLYRAYRDLYHKVNGVYPGPDVSDDLVDRVESVAKAEDSSESFGPELSPEFKQSETDFLRRAQEKLALHCRAMLSYDPVTKVAEFNQEEEIAGAKEVIRDLAEKYPDIKVGLSSETTIGALRQNCELLSTRIRRYLKELGAHRPSEETPSLISFPKTEASMETSSEEVTVRRKEKLD